MPIEVEDLTPETPQTGDKLMLVRGSGAGATARVAVIGTAAVYNVGEGAGQIPVLDATGKIPAARLPASNIAPLRQPAASFADSFVLEAGRIGYETDTRLFKMGDGSSVWSALDYAGGGGVSSWDDLADRPTDFFISRAAAIAATIPAEITLIWVFHGGMWLAYERHVDGTAMTTAGDVDWRPAGAEIWDKHFGTANDGATSDHVGAQAAITYWNALRATRSATLRFSPLLYLTAGLDFTGTGGKRGSVLGSSGGNMPTTEVRVNWNGYGSGAGAAAVFAFGNPASPAYQSSVEIGGFLFTRSTTDIRAPIGISGAALAQCYLHDITFGAWNNETISLLTPQNLKAENIDCFGGGRSFGYKDATDITVTQSGTTLTASASIFSAADVGKTIAIWGVSPSVYRRKARITGYTSATVVTVAVSVTDAVARRLFFGSPFITTTAAGTTITADASTFSADMVGLPICIEGAGASNGVHRAKIATYVSATQVTIDLAAVAATTTGYIATGALVLYSPSTFGNGASDIRMSKIKVEQHNGVGLVVMDADKFHIDGTLHAQQTVTGSTAYSQSAFWGSQVDGSMRVDVPAQYVGEHRFVIGYQTSTLHVHDMTMADALDEVPIRIRPRAPLFEGGIVLFHDLTLTNAHVGIVLTDAILDDNAGSSIPGYGLFGMFNPNDFAARTYHVGGASVTGLLAAKLATAALPDAIDAEWGDPVDAVAGWDDAGDKVSLPMAVASEATCYHVVTGALAGMADQGAALDRWLHGAMTLTPVAGDIDWLWALDPATSLEDPEDALIEANRPSNAEVSLTTATSDGGVFRLAFPEPDDAGLLAGLERRSIGHRLVNNDPSATLTVELFAPAVGYLTSRWRGALDDFDLLPGEEAHVWGRVRNGELDMDQIIRAAIWGEITVVAGSGGFTNTNNRTVANVLTGDLIVAAAVRTTGQAITTPTGKGWVLPTGSPFDDGRLLNTGRSIKLFWTFATADGDFNTGNFTNAARTWAVALRGVASVGRYAGASGDSASLAYVSLPAPLAPEAHVIGFTSRSATAHAKPASSTVLDTNTYNDTGSAGATSGAWWTMGEVTSHAPAALTQTSAVWETFAMELIPERLN